MLSAKVKHLFKNREFISVATCDLSGRPNVAPKFLLKIEGDYIYLVDYVQGRTFRNLQVNPRVSISIMDTETLIGYQVNGPVEIMSPEHVREEIMQEFLEKDISLAAERVIQGVKRGKGHQSYEAMFPDNIAVFRIHVEETVEIHPDGNLKHENPIKG